MNSFNPADLLTKETGRGLDDPVWKYGPPLLQHPEMWQEYVPSKANLDSIPILCGNLTLMKASSELPNPSNYKSLKDLLLATAKMHPSITDADERALIKAEILWIQHIQIFYFADVISFLETLKGNKLRSVEGKKIVRENKLVVPSLCLNLHLALDNVGLIRIKTSLANCKNLSYDQIYPILLPTKDEFTKLVIAQYHVDSGHMGINHTRAKIRSKFWIPKDTPIIKAVLKECKSCYDQRGQRYHISDSPDLPSFRFDVDHPWDTVFLDMTGHFFIKDKDENAEKVYFIVFVCASTGAGHIEIAMDASSQAFANTFERFCSRRGVPKTVISDQGSNFKGYNQELKQISEEITKNRFLLDKGVTWLFTPINDPHFNGYCERHLGILKQIMKKSVRNRLLTLDQLITVACYAEGLFNERPLSILEGSDPEVVPITPNTLVFGRNLRQFAHGIADGDQGDPDYIPSRRSYNVMHKKLRSTLAAVRKTWLSEYLSFLARKDAFRQKNAPFTKSLIVPQVNDWVLIKDKSKDLRIGKIIELIKSDDGEVRKCLLKTDHFEGIYPITNLRFLENKSDESKSNESCFSGVKELNFDKRPIRQAAKVAKSKLSCHT